MIWSGVKDGTPEEKKKQVLASDWWCGQLGVGFVSLRDALIRGGMRWKSK